METNKQITDYAKKKTVRIIWMIVRTLVWLWLTRLCIHAALHGERFSFDAWDYMKITFFIFPYLLLGGLYGYVLAYASFVVTFLTALFMGMGTPYDMSIYLVATTCFALFAQYFFFGTWKKTLIAAAGTLLCTSVIEFACLTVLASDAYNFSMLQNLGMYVSRDAFVIFVMAFFLFFFFNKTPDIIKLIFPIGTGYTKAFQENELIHRKLRKTRVSAKITGIIIGIELILGLFVAVFVIALFPDMKHMMAKNIAGNNRPEQVQREDGEEEFDEEALAGKIQELEYVMDNTAIAYDIKMVLLMLCIGVPLGGFANFYTKMTIGGPLGDLSDFMYEFANADDDKKKGYGESVDSLRVRTRDEIGVVYESARTMVHSIEEYIGRMEEEQKLQTELEVAKKASEAKSSFLSNMSHEIRTPINAVLGMNEMIIRESTDPKIEEYAQNVKNAGNSLLGIVNDILDFSKIEAGKMDIITAEYHLSSVVNDLVNMVSSKARDKGLELEVNVDRKIPGRLIGDEIRIKQCVTNVLSNAVKYTETGKVTMDVSYRKDEGNYIYLGFRVKDTGIGIKQEDLQKLFSPFERIEEIRNRSIEGTGLGMSIVKKLLALMDTKLEVKSVYGEGSDFFFEVRQQVADWEEIGDFKEKYREYLNSLKKYHESFRAPDAEILVVDDTAINLSVVKGLLKSTQIKVDTADSGRQTLEKVTKKKYDAIFIDHRMPDMDGLQTLAAMKSLDGNLNEGVPCIALTANAGAGARDEYIAAGFDDYLSKPVDGQKLEELLMACLPEDKVNKAIEPSDDEIDKDKDAAHENEEYGDFLDTLEGIDLDEAIKNCGSREVLRDVVREFLATIDNKADDIEKFADERDYVNYTVAVHALKSSARIVGAMELSKDAAYLEKCGEAEDESTIREKTPPLLALLRSYKDKLRNAAEKEDDDAGRPEIPGDELDSAFSDMKELLSAFDYDSAKGILDMLSSYRIPESHKEKYNKVKEMMTKVDREGLLEIL